MTFPKETVLVQFLAKNEKYPLYGESRALSQAITGIWDDSDAVRAILEGVKRRFGEKEVAKLVGDVSLNTAVQNDKTEVVKVRETFLPITKPGKSLAYSSE